MDNFKKNIDKLVSKILSEEIEIKSKKLSEQVKNEWTEVEVDEDLEGNRKNLDVAKPKGKLTAADFKKLRDAKNHKKEVEEWFYFDEEGGTQSTPGDYEGDEDAEEESEELSQQEPTYVGKGLNNSKMFGSFDDEHGWFDNDDRQVEPDFEYDDEEEFHDLPSLMDKYGKNQKWFGGNDGERFFKRYQDKFGGKPFKVRTLKGLEEDAETEEGNAFTGALSHAKEAGKDSFDVDGKKYQVKEAKKEKWIQKTDMKKGALHKKLGVPEGDKIPVSKLKSLKAELHKKSEGDKKLSPADSKLLKQVNLALTLKSVKEGKKSLQLTETELVDMIEKIVLEQKVKDKDEKQNIDKKAPEGLKKTEKVLSLNKKENDNYAKEVVKKMKDYMKDGSKGEYTENPTDFPKSNYQLDKDSKIMKYTPSDAVDEYIEAFSYPGMTNLVYDEIKPDDEKIDKYLTGDSTTGNAEKDKEGKALGNVVPSEVGKKFKKNYDDNLYGAEQMEVSYKRYPTPVDVAGPGKLSGTLKSKKGSISQSSANKAQNIMSKLESTEDKKTKVISEEMNKMKNLISYNRKTQ